MELGRQPLVHHALYDHHVRRLERRVNGAVVHRPLAADPGAARQRTQGDVVREAGVQHYGLTAHRFLRVDHRRQRLVVDHDGVGGVACHVAVACHDHRARVADDDLAAH